MSPLSFSFSFSPLPSRFPSLPPPIEGGIHFSSNGLYSFEICLKIIEDWQNLYVFSNWFLLVLFSSSSSSDDGKAPSKMAGIHFAPRRREERDDKIILPQIQDGSGGWKVAVVLVIMPFRIMRKPALSRSLCPRLLEMDPNNL